MGAIDIIIISLAVVTVVAVVGRQIWKKKNGQVGCCGDCSNCTSCPSNRRELEGKDI